MVMNPSIGAAAGLRDEPRWIVCEHDGTPIVQLPVNSFSCKEVLTGINEASIKTTLSVDTEMNDRLQPWAYTLVFVLGGQPIWGGPIVKHRSKIGQPETEIVVREWAHWLDRVWSQSDYDAEKDGARIIADRFNAAVNEHKQGYLNVTPLLNIWDGKTVDGDPVEVDFPNQNDEDISSPQSYWQEIQQVVSNGIDFLVTYEEEATGGGRKFTPKLSCSRYEAGPGEVTLRLGNDVATMDIDIDTDKQANYVSVIGEDLITGKGQMSDAPRLMKRFSYEYANTKQQVDTLALVLLDSFKDPVLSLGNITVPSLRADIRAGDLVDVEIPPGFDMRFPYGRTQTLRAMDVSWSASSSGLTTGYTLAARADQQRPGLYAAASGHQVPLRTTGFVEMLRDLMNRTDRLENRRQESTNG